MQLILTYSGISSSCPWPCPCPTSRDEGECVGDASFEGKPVLWRLFIEALFLETLWLESLWLGSLCFEDLFWEAETPFCEIIESPESPCFIKYC